jgi:hypothetical protein
VNQHIELLTSRESGKHVAFMLGYALDQRAGNPNIQPARFVPHDVNKVLFHTKALRSRFLTHPDTSSASQTLTSRGGIRNDTLLIMNREY